MSAIARLPTAAHVTFDLGRVARTVGEVADLLARPLRGSERDAVMHVLKSEHQLLSSVGATALRDGDATVRAGGAALLEAATSINATRDAVHDGARIIRRFRRDRFTAPGAQPLARLAQDQTRNGAALISDTPLAVRSRGSRPISDLDELVPSTLARSEDARYVTASPRRIQGTLRIASKIGLGKLLGIRVSGAEHVPKRGGFILVANHSFGVADTLFVGQGHRRDLHFMAAGAFERQALKSHVYRAGGAFPIDAGDPSRGMAIARRLVEEGHGVVIYPEQRTLRTDFIGEPRDGVAWLAQATGAPVIPTGVYGVKPGYTRGERMFSRPRVEVVFGPPVALEQGAVSAELLTATRERIWQGVDDAHQRARALRYVRADR